jgi:hypothetical protein
VSDFLGDGVIDTIMPNGVGAATGWLTSSGPNWDMTNDRPAPDDDGTYVRATTPGTKDIYNFEDVPTGAQIKGIQLVAMARKEEEGSSAIKPIIYQGTTEYPGPTQGVASIAYDRFITQPYDLNPATGNKFTDVEINGGQFGFEKVL